MTVQGRILPANSTVIYHYLFSQVRNLIKNYKRKFAPLYVVVPVTHRRRPIDEIPTIERDDDKVQKERLGGSSPSPLTTVQCEQKDDDNSMNVWLDKGRAGEPLDTIYDLIFQTPIFPLLIIRPDGHCR